ncbi:MAG: hypothetical protein MJE66_23700 [Proteobacteria bacterium]|nr:hypothetical protein [Pseudomonadota bacterium]
MSAESTATNGQRQLLRWTHRLTLATLGACLAFVALATQGDATPTRERTLAALALAAITILARRLAALAGPSAALRVGLLLGSFAAALGLAALGVGIAMQEEARQTGLLFVAAAVIFAIRPPLRADGQIS